MNNVILLLNGNWFLFLKYEWIDFMNNFEIWIEIYDPINELEYE